MRTIGCGLLTLALGLFAVSQVRADGADWRDPDYQSWRRAQEKIIDGGGFTPPRSRVTYSAIAYSPSLGRQGWARNYATPQAAQLAAMRACGGRDVRPIIWGASGSYLALAVGDGGAAGATGRTASQARAAALQECRRYTTNCKVYVVIYAP